MADTYTFEERGIRPQIGTVIGVQYTANATIAPNLIVEADSSGDVGPATAGSLRAVGVVGDIPSAAIYDPVTVLNGTVRYVADGGGVVAGYPLKCGTAGKATVLIDSTLAGAVLDTSSAGVGFILAGQPQNDTVSLVSAGAGDTTQSVTLYGTTQATDTVVVETVALNGAASVDTVKADWGFILGYSLDAACAGVVTLSEKSGGVTFSTIAAGLLSKGMDAVTGASVGTFNVAPIVAGVGGATTKVVGLIGTNAAGAAIYDSQPLNGTADVTMNTAFRTVTYFLTGDVEATRTVALKLGAEEDDDAKIGRAMETQAVDGDTFWGHFVP